ncbi:hypothetical protein [Methyloraptor flagellatus]|uniref:HNH endonuclease n=1 Tax=Methyloraptor flagellatus TaxID=3162530 RepID=A0AAU7XAE8_9HYPH
MNELVVRVYRGEKTKELARKLKAKAPGLTCRVCGGRDFALIEDVDGNSRTTLERKPIDGGFLHQFHLQPLLTVACTNCGHLEQFAQAIVDGAEPDAYGEEVDDG